MLSVNIVNMMELLLHRRLQNLVNCKFRVTRYLIFLLVSWIAQGKFSDRLRYQSFSNNLRSAESREAPTTSNPSAFAVERYCHVAMHRACGPPRGAVIWPEHRHLPHIRCDARAQLSFLSFAPRCFRETAGRRSADRGE